MKALRKSEALVTDPHQKVSVFVPGLNCSAGR